MADDCEPTIAAVEPVDAITKHTPLHRPLAVTSDSDRQLPTKMADTCRDWLTDCCLVLIIIIINDNL